MDYFKDSEAEDQSTNASSLRDHYHPLNPKHFQEEEICEKRIKEFEIPPAPTKEQLQKEIQTSFFNKENSHSKLDPCFKEMKEQSEVQRVIPQQIQVASEAEKQIRSFKSKTSNQKNPKNSSPTVVIKKKPKQPVYVQEDSSIEMFTQKSQGKSKQQKNQENEQNQSEQETQSCFNFDEHTIQLQMNQQKQKNGGPDLNQIFAKEITQSIQQSIPNQNQSNGDPFQFVLQMVQSAQNVNINMIVNQGQQNLEKIQEKELPGFQPPYSQPQNNPQSVPSPIGPAPGATPEKIFQSDLGKPQTTPSKTVDTMDNSIGNFDDTTPKKKIILQNSKKKDKKESPRKSVEYEIEPFENNSKELSGGESCDLMVQNNYGFNQNSSEIGDLSTKSATPASKNLDLDNNISRGDQILLAPMPRYGDKMRQQKDDTKFVNGLVPSKPQKQTNLQGFKIPPKPKIHSIDDEMADEEDKLQNQQVIPKQSLEQLAQNSVYSVQSHSDASLKLNQNKENTQSTNSSLKIIETKLPQNEQSQPKHFGMFTNPKRPTSISNIKTLKQDKLSSLHKKSQIQLKFGKSADKKSTKLDMNVIEDEIRDDEIYNSNQHSSAYSKVHIAAREEAIKKGRKLTAKEIEEYNQREFEQIYEDGVETLRKTTGFHPSGRPYYHWTPEMIEECKPYWTKPGVVRDSLLRRPDDPDYDPTTVHVPAKAWKQMSSCMIQYWRLKQNNFDKLIFFKLGKFYEVFDDDAVIMNKEIDIHWMSPDKKLHTSFPAKKLMKYIGLMTNLGYKVAIVESTETSRDCQVRKQNNKGTLNNKFIQNLSFDDQLAQKELLITNREISQIYTKGTFNDIEKDNYEPQFVMALSLDKSQDSKIDVGVCYFDVTTFKCYLGSFEDSHLYSTLRTVITKIRPVELVFEKGMSDKKLEKMLKSMPIQPVVNYLPQDKVKSIQKCQNDIDKYLYDKDDEQNGEINLQHRTLFQMRWKPEHLQAILAFGSAMAFLEIQMLEKVSIKFFEYLEFDLATNLSKNPYMVMDSQAIENLELTECIVNGATTIEGSLLEWVDHTKTLFGKRMIRKWLLTPLLDPFKINERLDAVQDMMQMKWYTDEFRKRLANCIDLEKQLARLFVYSVTNEKKTVKYEMVGYKKLKEFKDVLVQFKKIPHLLQPLRTHKHHMHSRRLKALVTLNSEDSSGMFPDMNEAIQELDYLVLWKKNTGLPQVPGGEEEIAEPRRGIDPEFDKQNDKVTEIKQHLNQYLEQIKSQLRRSWRNQRMQQINSIKFAHTNFRRFEIEIPIDIVKGDKKPEELVLTSQKTGFQRFHSDRIKEFVNQLELEEDKLKEAIQPFVCAVFQRFYQNRKLWTPAVQVLQELDCLQSLAIASSQMSYDQVCRPMIVPDFDFDGKCIRDPFIQLENMIHPGVKMKNQKEKNKRMKDFVPNSTIMNCQDEKSKALLVTGPNMGGKSTLLRQTCLAVILAQMGCYVPAQKCILTPVDRIFTRLGASDRILEGKSTFFIEMEETKNILQYGTNRSLAIVDELGRGTSTFDGYSIAYSVLNYMLKKIECRCLFATHYHMLLDDFRDYSGVSSYFMACEQDQIHPDKIKFLYKFIKGDCPNSFGMNVALMSGLDSKIVEFAKQKSDEFSQKMLELNSQLKLRELTGGDRSDEIQVEHS